MSTLGIISQMSIGSKLFYGSLGLFVVVYAMFQKKMFSKPMTLFISKIMFYPTFPITVLMRLGNYYSIVDDTLILGCAPLYPGIVKDLYQKHNVRGVINMCGEYNGEVSQYEALGIKQLHLPAVDHYEPSLQQYEKAVKFIQSFKNKNNGQKTNDSDSDSTGSGDSDKDKLIGGSSSPSLSVCNANEGEKEMVYVHCKAGHGRAAGVALCWLISQNKDRDISVKDLNMLLKSKRKVRGTLHQQQNVMAFAATQKKA